MTTARVKEDGAPRFFGGRMKLKLGVVVLAALAIELVNFFLLAFPIDVGDPPGTPWYLQLLGDQWVALHAIGLFSLGWFERVCAVSN